MSEGIRFNLRIDRRGLEGLARLNGQVPRALKLGVERVLMDLSNRIQMKIRAGDVLNRRSGALARSWAPKGKDADYEVTVNGATVRGHLGSRLAYAAIHEYGGTVTPKAAKLLAIPLDAAKTKAGVARKGPRDYPDLFPLYKRGRNNPPTSLARTRGGAKLEILFALKERVQIPATHYVSLAVKAREPVAPRIMDAAIQEEIDRMEAK